MIRAGKQIAASALLLIVFCFVCRLTFFRDYNAYVLLNPVQETEFRRDGVYVTIEQPGIVSSRSSATATSECPSTPNSEAGQISISQRIQAKGKPSVR